MVTSLNEIILSTLLSNYELNKDIFNADEFGLFYQCLSNKTYQFNGENFSRGMKNKVIFIGMVKGNGTEWNLHFLLLAIEKFWLL